MRMFSAASSFPKKRLPFIFDALRRQISTNRCPAAYPVLRRVGVVSMTMRAIVTSVQPGRLMVLDLETRQRIAVITPTHAGFGR